MTSTLCSVNTPEGRCSGWWRSLQHAASHVATLGLGATLKIDGCIVWTEGVDGRAYDLSYRRVEALIEKRLTRTARII